MSIDGLLELISEVPEFARIRDGLDTRCREQMVVGLTGSQKALFLAGLFRDGRRRNRNEVPTLVVTHSPYQADRLHHDLVAVLPPPDVLLFPALETLPHEEVLPNADLLRDRLAVYDAFVQRTVGLVVTSVQALCERLMPPSAYAAHLLPFEAKLRLPLGDVARQLAIMGYERVEKVEGKGQFSIRGGILDVFSMTRDTPWRIEFFDDEIDSIRTFDPASQRSLEPLERAVLSPAREMLISPEALDAGLERMHQRARVQAGRLQKLGNAKVAEDLGKRVAEHVERFRHHGYFPGAEQYKPFFFESLATLVDYMPRGSIVVDEPARVREHLGSFEAEFAERHALLLERGRILAEEAQIYASWPDLYHSLRKRPLLHFASLNKRVQGMEPEQQVNVSARTPEVFHGQMDRLVQAVRRWRDERFRVCLVLSTAERGERVAEAFKDEGLPAIVVPELNGHAKPGNVVITTGALSAGGEFPGSRLVVLTDTEVFGRPKRRRRVRTDENGQRVVDFGDLHEGDFVVHVNHGIGQYVGVETLDIGGMHKDYLVVKYAGEDKLYVPTDQIDLLQKYIGVEGQPPKLYKLGGNDWARVKKRVKESVQEMAQGLLRLYAEREAVPGYAYAPDTVWQQQFEDTFPYEETPDQERAIGDVKQDMERPRPMDRLLCGDVGYGKTEVAIRAAFKAVMDGRQVAVLVPTTILAQQHGRTFAERFEGYPVSIRVLSRFESPSEQRAVLRGIQAGTVDVVIGTHRILSKDVRFKDLGLIVVDEEQRFGVAQKERLKELKKNVDVLTLTATPIPRTLHMSLVGVRDMSLIETPPEDRFPIRTYVMEYDEDLAREAILRELAREGQVYFVHNRVQSIDRMASRLMEIVPEARLAVAHGQMDEDDLERVMLDFLRGEYDVLLCSTIIETGMDISNVNTLIVYDADRLGLAQLYQLRGRVGRSNRVAYAYFTYRRDKLLSEDAEKRLQAIKEFTELGSGFKIAMRDLEIRGAGNLLGSEQHGFIASVGFELYCRLLEESIRELRGEVVQQPPEVSIDLNVDAYISDEYIADSQQKVEIYKKVIAVRNARDASLLEEELVDRFGDSPAAVKNLLAVARIKALGRRLGVSQISGERDGVVVKFLAGLSLPTDGWYPMARKHKGRVSFAPGRMSQLKLRTRGLSDGELLPLLEAALLDVQELCDADRAPARAAEPIAAASSRS